jgi:hypothetical protein
MTTPRTRRLLFVVPVILLTAGVILGWQLLRSETSSPATPSFADESSTAGVRQVYDGEYPFFVGGGLAVFDCNDDWFPELFIAGGENPSALYINKSTVGGSLSFAMDPSAVTSRRKVTGAYPIDIDSDHHVDIVVLGRGGNAVLRGTGDCKFEDATTSLGLEPGSEWTVGFSATWEESERLPTLAFGNYLIPDSLDCSANTLYRPTSDLYSDSISLPAHCTLSLLFSDWNREGHRDLRVSNDRNYDREAQEQMWRIQAGESPREYSEADGWKPLTIWGMGIASQDLTGDSRPEVFLTSQADNKLQTLDIDATGPSYRDVALRSGVTAQRPYVGGDVLPSTAWHPEFDDVNNDGFMDLLITKGNVEGQLDYASNDPNNLLLGTRDGVFVERGDRAGIANASRSRGASLVDLNLDGLLDLVVVNRRVPVEIKRNVGSGTPASPRAMGHWLAFRLRQPAPNVDAIGAWIDVRVGDRVISREITVGGGHASGELGWVHFGLGDATSAEVRLQFPGGTPGEWIEVEPDSFYVVDRDAATPERQEISGKPTGDSRR